jgi:hypothetical protein
VLKELQLTTIELDQFDTIEVSSDTLLEVE